jgi:hypothetical protein
MVFEKNGSIFLKDYLGINYNLEDVTDDGELFDPVRGWFPYFYLNSDIDTIRHFSSGKTEDIQKKNKRNFFTRGE